MPTSIARLVPLLLLVGLASAACSGDDPAPSTARSTPDSPGPTVTETATSPAGHSYVSTEVEGIPIPGEGPLTLVFAGGGISANAGCNTLAGQVTLDDGVLRAGPLASTLMGCPPPQSEADAWAQSLLTASPTWELRGGTTLILRTPDRTVTLTDKQVAQPPAPLRGTAWVVTGISTPEAHTTSQTITDIRPNLTIAEDGSVSGSSGCNRITGTAEVDPAGSPIVFRVASTRMMCAPEVMEVETAVLKTLDGSATAEIEGDTLVLRNDNGNGLTLRAE